MSNSHDASGQFAGYLYQVLAAMLLLIQNKDPEAKICIEKFDDVSFVDDDNAQVMIQTKHQLFQKGNLNNTSVDLWRTIKSWCDSISSGLIDTDTTRFLILTTATAKSETAVAYLTNSSQRDVNKAMQLLLNVANNGMVESNQKFYKRFLELSEAERESLIKHIYIYDNRSSILDIKDDIMPYIRCVTLPEHEEKVYDRIMGWWIRNVIYCLSSREPIFINRRQIQNEMYDVGSQYKTDSLPINIDPYYEPTDQEVLDTLPEKQIFIEQLKQIALSNDSIKRCIRDYYNAYCQRSRWLRENVLFIDEFPKYEKALIDEWQRLFSIMKEDLEDYGDNVNEKQMQKAGRNLFRKIEELDHPIRKSVTHTFIMRGTYHGLAERLDVGWHVEFQNRLYHLLKEY